MGVALVLNYLEPAQKKRGRGRKMRLMGDTLSTNFGQRYLVHWQLPHPPFNAVE